MELSDVPAKKSQRSTRERIATEKAELITPPLMISVSVGRGAHIFSILELAKNPHELRECLNRIGRAIYSLSQDDPLGETSTICASATVSCRGISFGEVTYQNDALLPLAAEKAKVDLRFNFARPDRLEAYRGGQLVCGLDPVPSSSQGAGEEGL